MKKRKLKRIEKKEIKTEILPLTVKRAIAQSLKEMGYMTKDIAVFFGIKKRTADTWLADQRKEVKRLKELVKIRQFFDDVKLGNLSYKKLVKELPTASYGETLQTYKIVRELQREQTKQIGSATQININIVEDEKNKKLVVESEE